MSIPKEPRQQMINMMYIVLTALLALNVSAEVLNAFKQVSDGMETSNNAIDTKNNQTMAKFAAAAGRTKDKNIAQYYADAQTATKLADDFNAYVDSLREEVVAHSGGWKMGDDGKPIKGVLKDKKNYDGPTHVLVYKPEEKGPELEKKINELRENLLALPSLTPEDTALLASQMTLSTKYNEKEAKRLGKKTWSEFHFDHVPVVAVNTLLYKYQGDAETSAGLIVETLYARIGEQKYDFDALAASVFANTNYVLQGNNYEAEIFVTAYSSSNDPQVYYGQFKPGIRKPDGSFPSVTAEDPLVNGGTMIEDIVAGRAQYKAKATKLGENEVTGAVKVRKPNSNDFEYYLFSQTYTVAQPGVIVSPDKMNVFYIGVDNPVSISVPGFPSDRVSASLSTGGSIKRAKGEEYTVNVNKVGECEVVVSVKQDDGKNKVMGKKPFRIKRIPDPIGKVGNLTGGKVPAARFKVQRGVLAVLENFNFDLTFEVLSFELTYSAKRQDLVVVKGTGPAFTQEMLSLLNKAKPGDVFYIDEIRVKGPDKVVRKLPSIAYTLI